MDRGPWQDPGMSKELDMTEHTYTHAVQCGQKIKS